METITTSTTLQKGTVYQLLSALFCEPEPETYTDGIIFDRLEGAGQNLSNTLGQQIRYLKKEFNKQTQEQLLVDYSSIFLGPFGAIANPYASVYLSEDGLNSKVTTWVEDFYRKCGLEFDYDVKNLPDDLVIELEFLYNLLYMEVEAEKSQNFEQANLLADYRKQFLTEHFIAWTGKMAELIMESNVNSFYSALAHLLVSFAVFDQKELQESS